MPSLRRSANRSCSASVSAQTRVMIAPTVRQAIRINSVTALLEHWVASQATESPMALISLLTAERQWFKSRLGVDAPETSRDWAFCSHAILQDGLFMVEDAARDPRFQDNALVVGEPHIRFYAAFPLFGAGKTPLGTLCVLDREPRRLREREIRSLQELAAIASEEIQRR